jgi:hypothetical protein
MRTYITISLDDQNGEADLTPASKDVVETMVSRGDLLDYDQLSDIFHIFRDAFERVDGTYYPDRKLTVLTSVTDKVS